VTSRVNHDGEGIGPKKRPGSSNSEWMVWESSNARTLRGCNWSRLTKGVVSVRKRKVELLEAEMKPPGRECAYVFRARQRFRNSAARSRVNRLFGSPAFARTVRWIDAIRRGTLALTSVLSDTRTMLARAKALDEVCPDVSRTRKSQTWRLTCYAYSYGPRANQPPTSLLAQSARVHVRLVSRGTLRAERSAQGTLIP
jgi:hypothetical protein